MQDQMGNWIDLKTPPRRIISLVPSQTELLFDLGLDETLVGITKFCIHPSEKFKIKSKVGGTKTLYMDRIVALKPDLIIGNKEENEESQIRELMKHYPVWMSDIKTQDDALEMIALVGELVSRREESLKLIADIKKEFSFLPLPFENRKRVAYFIWKDPYMLAGTDTFIDSILQIGGWDNAVKTSRYPELSKDTIAEINPDLIFLSSEPYPFSDKHAKEFQEICPSAKVMVVDGELFSWYGSRLLKTPAYLQQLHLQVN